MDGLWYKIGNGILCSEARLWRRAKVGDNILDFDDFDLLRALAKINRKRWDFWSNIYFQYWFDFRPIQNKDHTDCILKRTGVKSVLTIDVAPKVSSFSVNFCQWSQKVKVTKLKKGILCAMLKNDLQKQKWHELYSELRHRILYNSSASKNRQFTGFR